jgi:Na+/H+ antiporter NhaA
MNAKHLGVVGILGGIGFTRSLILIENALVGQASRFACSVLRSHVIYHITTSSDLNRRPVTPTTLSLSV